VARLLDVPSSRSCKRALPDAVRPLVRAADDDTARRELERFE
jgi:hypothetical protein